MNSIAAYLIAHLWEDFIVENLRINLGTAPFRIFGAAYQPLMMGIAVMCVYWIFLYWMYRRRIFLRV